LQIDEEMEDLEERNGWDMEGVNAALGEKDQIILIIEIYR
jgi:hypothetical protein